MEILEEDLKERMGVGVDDISSTISRSDSVCLKVQNSWFLPISTMLSIYHPHAPPPEAEVCQASGGSSAQIKGKGMGSQRTCREQLQAQLAAWDGDRSPLSF